jgi:glycosyltransferase involved in cell wall biosynthesis
MSRPTIICITPVKNEEWILARFLKCASLWADHIIVADQGSTDGSRELAKKFSKVILTENPSPTFNEPERQRLLIEAARQISGRRLLIALDADEFLTANFMTSPEWETLLQAEDGTIIYFDWPTVLSGPYRYFLYPTPLPLGFVDDGSAHSGKTIHSPRIPLPSQASKLFLKTIKVMHYVGTDLSRWHSKLRWYQVWEYLNHPNRGLINLYRFYHKDVGISPHMIVPLPQEWLLGYEKHGIDMTSVSQPDVFRWDKEVIQLFIKHGGRYFKKLAIWDVNWSQLYKEIYGDDTNIDLRDPRSRLDKFIHAWLHRTQPHFSHYGTPLPIHLRLFSSFMYRFLKLIKW